MTFAFYFPENHSPEQIEDNSCNSTSRKCPVEIWGKPENVVKGINVHNQVIKDLVSTYDVKLFVDRNSLISKNENNFNDICHLTRNGSKQFVDNILNLFINNGYIPRLGIPLITSERKN